MSRASRPRIGAAWRGGVVLPATLLGAAVTVTVPRPLVAQISPGPLASAHRQLEGALNCTQCHGARRDAMTAACQSCHRDIAWLVEQRRGYHGRQPAVTKTCQSCHPDHAGADFALIEWPGGAAERFDHRQAGWALDGGHATITCEACHAAVYRVSVAAKRSKRTSSAGWVGLQTDCVSCHRSDDVHRGALTGECERCHDTREWASVPKFDHAKTDYPLTGKHSQVACDQCHLSPKLPLQHDAAGRPVPIYAPVAFASCADCHDDPHRGRLSTRCADCHTTRSFTRIDQRGFNHSLTRYPLKGGHVTAPCAGCHGADLANPRPAFATCAGCHRDVHGGEATLAGAAVDCAACHRVQGFTPSTYDVAAHRQAAYRLEGRHRQVACDRCHAPRPAAKGSRALGGARIRMPFDDCTDCHGDSHGGQLARSDGGPACEGCHTVNGFAPSTFDAARHARLRLPLEGRHAAAACSACHAAAPTGLPVRANRASLGAAGIALALPSATCASCHLDSHAGRYESGGRWPTTASCAGCHGTTTFRPTTLAAAGHERFGLALEKAHAATPCVGCHHELRAQPAASTLLLAASGVLRFPAQPSLNRATNCAACHESPHGDQFSDRRQSASCQGCHDVDVFAPAGRFDHNRDSTFPLRGAHERVACAACHRTETAGGVARVRYRPTASKCESCHGGTSNGRRA